MDMENILAYLIYLGDPRRKFLAICMTKYGKNLKARKKILSRKPGK